MTDSGDTKVEVFTDDDYETYADSISSIIKKVWICLQVLIMT